MNFCRTAGIAPKRRTMPIEDDIANFYNLMEKQKGQFWFYQSAFRIHYRATKSCIDRTIPRRGQGLRLKDKIDCGITVEIRGMMTRKRHGNNSCLDAYPRNNSCRRQ